MESILQLAAPTCAVVSTLDSGQRVRCRNPGIGPTLAVVEGGTPAGWDSIGSAHARNKECKTCPVASLPSDVIPLEVEATARGLQLQVAAESSALAIAYHTFREQGQEPTVRRMRNQTTPRTVDLSVLTARQQEALEIATKKGYFGANQVTMEDLGAAMGCGKSTAHEHLRRAVAAVMRELF